MAVGRGSMERAAKAAGTEAAARKTDNRSQSPYRRLTISEIVGETSTIEPPRTRRTPAKPVVKNEPPAAVEKAAVKSEPVATEKAAVEVKSEPVAVKGPTVKNEAMVKSDAMAAAEGSKAASVAKSEAIAVLAEAGNKAASIAKSDPVATEKTMTVEKASAKSESVTVKEPTIKNDAMSAAEETEKPAPPVKPEPASAQETGGQIVYQKSSGMLERAAEPNEQFGLGDAMPVYYF
ncbi:MAG: hypothetical protein NC400_05455 [Clostridium sp.]|nr:hypothetical protein [Clostridium sp.]